MHLVTCHLKTSPAESESEEEGSHQTTIHVTSNPHSNPVEQIFIWCVWYEFDRGIIRVLFFLPKTARECVNIKPIHL